MLDADPQAKRAGAKVGDVVEVDRDDLGKESKMYKLIVQS